MVLKKQVEPQNQLPKTPGEIDGQADITEGKLPEGNSTIAKRLEELESLPHRNRALHWAAFTLSLMSLILLSAWVFSSRGPVPGAWVWLDIGLGVVFAIEFFTRSGFRWTRVTYLRTHFFDFVAIVPALALVNHGFIIESVWVWIILVARAARVIDRLFGDGFIRRTILALVEGFEEEITDRVLERMIARIQAEMDRAGFSHGVADAFKRNKTTVLQRVRAATPHDGFVPGLAHITGLDAALERAEERAYDAIVGVIGSEAVDHVVRDIVSSSFSRMRDELGTKSWRQHLGLRRRRDKMKELRNG
jgi:energy-coupling factor transporter transmembrane protein EcfT